MVRFTPLSKSELGVVVLANRAGQPPLPFEVGASLLARIVAQEGDQVTLALLGRTLTCRTELDLPQGALVNLLVREARPDRVVLSPQPPPAENPAGEQQVLRSLGLPTSPEAALVAKRLLEQGLPLEPRLFREVWQNLARLGASGSPLGEQTAAKTHSQAHPDPQAQPAPGAQPQVESHSQVQPEPQMQPVSQPQGQPQPVALPQSQPHAQAPPQPEQAAVPQSATSAQSEPPSQSGQAATSQQTIQPGPRPDPQPGVHTGAPVGPHPDPQSAVQAGSLPGANPPVQAEPQANPQPVTTGRQLPPLETLQGGALPVMGPPERVIDAVIFLVANARPVTPESVRAILAVRDDAPDLGKLLTDLSQAIRELETASTGLAAAGRDWPPDLIRELRDVARLLGNLRSLPFDGHPSALQALLEQTLSDLGLDYERRIMDFLTATREAPTASDPVTQQAGGRHAGEQQAGTLPDAARQSHQSAVPDPRGTLKGLLLSIRERLAELGEKPAAGAPVAPQALTTTPEQSEAASLARLARSTAEVLHNLNGQRLASGTSERPGQPPIELFVQIPVQVGADSHTAELRFYVDPEKKRRRGGPRETLRVSCRLTTTNLGPVRLDLNLRGRQIDCHLMLASEAIVSYLRAHQAELEQAMTEAGFAIGDISYAKRRRADEAAQETHAPALGHLNLKL